MSGFLPTLLLLLFTFVLGIGLGWLVWNNSDAA
jgi:hypothetical protein